MNISSTMDPLLPNLSIHDTSVPIERQQCVLAATREARTVIVKKKQHPPQQHVSVPKFRNEKTAFYEARKRCEIYTKKPTEKQYLGQLIMIFGKYDGKTLKWMLENDVGYVKFILDKHVRERENPAAEINDGWIKDALLKYVEYFYPVLSHLEKYVDKTLYGCGRFKSFNFKEMWEWYKQHLIVQSDPQLGTAHERQMSMEAYLSVNQWLNLDESRINSKSMKRFRQYILDKKKASNVVKNIVSSKSDPKPSTSKPSSSVKDTYKVLDDPTWVDDSILIQAAEMYSKDQEPSTKLDTSTNTLPLSSKKSSITGQLSTTDRSEDQTSEISYEGWHKSWESSLPKADINWLKNNAERGLFQNTHHYTDKHGEIQSRKVLKDDRMWFFPPECPGMVQGGVPKADSFFRSRVFFWRPVGVWKYSLKCPRKDCPAKDNSKVFLYRCGYSKTVRYICDMDNWYCMLTEVLACNACGKAAKSSSGQKIGRFLAWSPDIMTQLTPAHQSLFPAILTPMRGVDKKVIRLMCDRTAGNTMIKVWRQVQESHCEQYLNRKDIYTTLLTSMTKQGSIVDYFGHKFEPPPERKELPSARLFRKAYLISEAGNIEDYRAQIMSTFGKVLKFDSTKKICKKLSGAGKGTAEWCTNVGNESSEVLTSVLTCEESLEKLTPMANGLISRYQKAGEPAPELMYVDRGCCRVNGVTSIESLFQEWVDEGMIIRLDVFHWIHRFDAAVRTDHHPKYELFKSALSAAVFGYNKDDMALLVKAIRAGSASYKSLSDERITYKYVTREQLKHYVRRVTLGAHETYERVTTAIELLKGEAGMDDNNIHLFKDDDAIDNVWAAQQKHLECIQDPPGRSMYKITKYITKNGQRIPHYTTVRGSNSLEGFHAFLPQMIPGPHCAAIPFQVYLLSGIARWNSDRQSAAVMGQKGRKHMTFRTPILHRLNERCKTLFGTTEDINFRAPMPIGDEMIGLEYLFSQSTESFQVEEHYKMTRETVQQEDDGDNEADDNADETASDVDIGYVSDEDQQQTLKTIITLTDAESNPERDPCIEDVCSCHHLPGFQAVEKLSDVLVSTESGETKLSLNPNQRRQITEAWNNLSHHDRDIHQFDSLYHSRWGNTLFGRTKGDPAQASLIQKLKFNKRFAPAHLIDARKNRLMYCVIKQLWLSNDTHESSPKKRQITTAYQRIQHRVTVDDPILCTLGIPLLKINVKCVAEFIRRQEAMASRNVTNQGLAIVRRYQSISDIIPPAEELPEIRPVTNRPETEYIEIPDMSGTRGTKSRLNIPVKQIQDNVPSAPPSSTFETTTTFRPASSITVTSSTIPPIASTSSNLPQWSRSTIYRKRKQDPLNIDINKTVKLYNCKLCSSATQGHRKYRKKTFCPATNKSTSLPGQVFVDFEDFKQKVDQQLDNAN